jgi:hypothetical protein
MAGTSPDLACNYTDTRSSQPNRVCHTPDFSYPLISSISFSFSFTISHLHVHNCTIMAEYKVTMSLSISPCDDHELTSSTAYIEYNIHRVQHTQSTAYIEYRIHRVQHTPSTAYTKYSILRVLRTPITASTQDCLSSFHSHDYELTPESRFSFRRPSLHDRLPSFSSQ